MDALDEFFRVWSEPEAWCERCQSAPAIHVVVYDEDHMDGMTITYAYIWEAETRSQIPICRSCSADYIDSLGSSEFKYANRKQRKTLAVASRQAFLVNLRTAFINLIRGLSASFSWPSKRRSVRASEAQVYLSRSQQ